MKILGIILAILMLGSSALVGLAGSSKARDTAKQLSAVTNGLSAAEKAALEKEAGIQVPSTSRLNNGGIVGMIGALAAVALLIVTFAKKDLVSKFAIATVVLIGVSAAVYPYVKTGPMDGIAPRTQAIVAAVLALIGAFGATLAARKPAA